MGTVRELEVHDLGKLWELDIVEDNQGAVHTAHGLVGDTRFSNIIPEIKGC